MVLLVVFQLLLDAAGFRLLTLELLFGLPGFLLLLGLLDDHPADKAHQKKDGGQDQQDLDEEVAEDGVHTVKECHEGGEGHVIHGHHVHLGVFLAVIDDRNGAQRLTGGDGGDGVLAVHGQAEVQLGLVVLAGDQGADGLCGVDHHMGGVRRELYGYLFQIGVGVQQGGGGEVIEAPVQKLGGLGELLAVKFVGADLRVFAAQDHGAQGGALPGGGGDQAVACLGGGAGLDADGAGVNIAVVLESGQQTVGVVQGSLPGLVGGGDGVSVGGDQLPEGGVGHGFLGHGVDVPGGGVMVRVVQTVGVHKVGAIHAQLLGTLVHLLHEGGDVPAHGHGQDVGRFVGRDHHQAVQQVLDGDLLPGHDVGGGGVVSDVCQSGGIYRDYIVHGELTPGHGLHRQKGGHDLGDTGGVAHLVGVHLMEDLAGAHVHQEGGGGLQGHRFYARVFHRCCPRQEGSGEEDHGQEKRKGANQHFFHRKHTHPVL